LIGNHSINQNRLSLAISANAPVIAVDFTPTIPLLPDLLSASCFARLGETGSFCSGDVFLFILVSSQFLGTISNDSNWASWVVLIALISSSALLDIQFKNMHQSLALML